MKKQGFLIVFMLLCFASMSSFSSNNGISGIKMNEIQKKNQKEIEFILKMKKMC